MAKLTGFANHPGEQKEQAIMSQAPDTEMPKFEIANLRYNPAESGFEALVTIHQTGVANSYPCSISAPLNASYETIVRALRVKVGRLHRDRLSGAKRKIGEVSICSRIFSEMPDFATAIAGRHAA